ncbi:hypothetical protein PX860_22865 [Agrobacterium leguminum]|uniref:hypothetical protein n=1 Tax=Agrobacterium leguminum TaxID=2792015 RepID=UPI00272C0A42|nr:hypothetical protein [Agrobacterium leguminum]WLD99919.1 hypothetical protein PX860_22865 [Agrobacterium leguminum]
MKAAVRAATLAATSPWAMQWDSKAKGAAKLPQELFGNPAHLAIFLLPEAFTKMGLLKAAECARVWLFGKGKSHSAAEARHPETDEKWRVCRFSLSEFRDSEMLKTQVDRLLGDAHDKLPAVATPDGFKDSRWDGLKTAAGKAIDNFQGKASWERSLSFTDRIVNPPIYITAYQVTKLDFIAKDEWITRSDLYASFGDFALRSYLAAKIVKKKGDDQVYLQPKSVAVRLWDDYDFVEKSVLRACAPLIPSICSEVLGWWMDEATGTTITLNDNDFVSFRRDFLPVYNATKPREKPALLCLDFHPYSDFSVRKVEAAPEYPLPGLKAK